MSIQSREGPIVWTRDLNGSTGTTVYPTLATDGVANPGMTGRNGPRVHVGLDYTVGSGVMSCQIGVYGYANSSSAGWGASTWVYLGALNGGSSITANAATWTQSATRITLSEVFTASGESFTRYATRSYAPGGTSPVISTYIGFPLE
jgi:hypothetical protein